MLRLKFILLLSLFPLLLFCQLKSKEKTRRTFYEDGAIKKMTRVKTLQSRNFLLYDTYKRTITIEHEFYNTGVMKAKTKNVFKIGPWGRPCYDVKYERTEFNEKGKRQCYEKELCDEEKHILKEYDDHGRLVKATKTIKKVKYR